MQKPSRAGLQMICSQVEAWESYMPLKVREKAQRAVAQILADGTLAAEEDMLRLYRIMAKHSRRMGASKVFEKVEEQGRFICSLKFHIMWAETYAQSGNLDRFTHVLNLARSRLPELSPIELEAGFRDLADQYFPNSDIFNDDEETMAVFKIQKVGDPKTKRSARFSLFRTFRRTFKCFLTDRRRSSLAAFEAHAKDNLKAAHGPANPTFGQNTRTKLRFELVDRPEAGYLAPSIEELRAAMIADQQMEENDDLLVVPMDITMNCTEPAAASHHLAGVPELKELGKRNRILETVEEVDSDFSNEDKRRRVFSPAAPVRESVLARQQKQAAQPSKSSTQPSSSATFITGSSFTEKAYNDMKAMLSDTVDINKVGGLPGITDETTLPVAAPAIEAFEVFIDKDESQRPSSLKQNENLSAHPVTHSRPQGERAPLQQIPVQVAGGDSEKLTDIKRKGVLTNVREEEVFKPQKFLQIEDEETVAGAKFSCLGIDKKPDRGIVTSTPAYQMHHPPTHEDFFAP
ncbi:hypothetical protein OSTOST_24156, partial [Ostertagia ostertagi]